MPTYFRLAKFLRDYHNLSPGQRALLKIALGHFIEDIKRDGHFRASLRVKRVQGTRYWEMTWDDDGRCTFEYGREVTRGQKHIIWRRCGSHDIFVNP